MNEHDDDRFDEVPSVIPMSEAVPTVRAAPITPPRPGFWGALLWCLAFVAVMVVSAGIVITIDLVVEINSQPDRNAFMEKVLDLGPNNDQLHPAMAHALRWGMFAAELTTILFGLIILRFVVGREWKRKIAFAPPTLEHAALAVMCVPAFIIVSGLVGYAIQSGFEALLPVPQEEVPLEKILAQIFDSWPTWMAVLVIGVGPGIGEELWCRGFLGRGLVGRYGVVAGVIATSFFFGAMHGPSIPYIMVTFFMGACLHLIYLATRSIFVSMFVHFANNSIATMLAMKSLDLPFLNADTAVPPLPIVFSAVGLFIACGYAFWLGRARLVDSDEPLPVWRPYHAGVELPPAESRTVVERPSVMGLPMGMVVLMFGAFVLSCVFAG